MNLFWPIPDKVTWGNTYSASTTFPHNKSPSSLHSGYCSLHWVKQQLAPEQEKHSVTYSGVEPREAVTCSSKAALLKSTQPTKQRYGGGDLRESADRHPSVCIAIPASTTSLGSTTDTYNYNRDCSCTKYFPSRLKTLTWAC